MAIRIFILAEGAHLSDLYRRAEGLDAQEAGYVISVDTITPVAGGRGELRIIGHGARRQDAHAVQARAQACGLKIIGVSHQPRVVAIKARGAPPYAKASAGKVA
ncbi:MAG: hypothetical protein HQ512_04625 [Rhodospirillales bacterium]|nr:hypothetical protein [Rhodospirillales bacterium]